MAPGPGSAHKRSNNETQITCVDDDLENKDENGKVMSSEMIPLKFPTRTVSSYENEEAEKVRRILVTGCSCVESMKKMWTQLQLLEDTSSSNVPTVPTSPLVLAEQDEVDTIARSHSISTSNPQVYFDVPDQIASTTELISTRRSHQSVPNKDVQKEASIMRKHWCRLVQKMPDENTLLLCRAIQKKPLLLQPFLEMLSGCISFVPPASGKHEDGLEDETTIHMDMRNLLECPGDEPNEFREAQVLLHLVDEIEDMDVKDKILAHPVIATFATLKYQKYRFVSIMLLIYHLLFAILFTNYAFHVFLAKHPEEIVIFTKYSSVVLTLMAVLSSVKTVTTFFASGLQFDLTTSRRIGEIFCAFVSFFMCLLPSFGYKFPFTRQSVNKDITAFGVMSSWLVLLSYLTKFNQTAVYVQTFFQIVKNYIHFLWMVALCQLIALSASYSLIFHKKEHGLTLTGNFSRSVIRVLTGRMNYDDFTGEKADLENPLSVFNYFFIFFVLSTVMMAMIIGLAQNGLQDTSKASAVNVLCQVIKDISELEWIIWRLNAIFPQKLNLWLTKKISIKDFLLPDKTILEIRPHDSSNKTIPSSLKKSIYEHLMERGATCHR